MFKLTSFCKWMNSAYHDFWIRVLVSLFAGHFIVSHGYGFIAVIAAPGYFLSLCYSAAIALILFQCVNSITVTLDYYLPWLRQRNKRLLAQTVFGVIGCCVLAYSLATGLFWLMGSRIEDSSYMKYDFYIICLYVFLINAYYYVYAGLKRKEMIKAELDHFKQYHRNYAIKNAPLNLAEVDFPALALLPSTIACFCYIGGNLRLYDMNGHYTLATEKLNNILLQLPRTDYITVNRYCILHRLLIVSWESASSRRLALVLRAPFDSLIPTNRKEVSQGNKEIFLKAYHQAV